MSASADIQSSHQIQPPFLPYKCNVFGTQECNEASSAFAGAFSGKSQSHHNLSRKQLTARNFVRLDGSFTFMRGFYKGKGMSSAQIKGVL